MEEKRRGRPKVSIDRKHQYRVTLSDEENEMLNKLSEKTQLSKAEVIRVSLEMYNNRAKFMWN